jgi:predicted esterase
MIKLKHLIFDLDLKFVIWILILSFTSSLGISGSLTVDPDSDCFYTPFDSAPAGQYCPALIILSCTGATRTDLDSIIPMADSLGIIAATCHASRNHRDIGANDRDIMRTYEKLVRDYPVDPERVLIYGFSGQAVQALTELFNHPASFRGVVSVCGHAGAMPEAKMAELEGKLIYLISKEEDWNLKANQEMYNTFFTSNINVKLFVAPGPHAPAAAKDLFTALKWLAENSK